MRPRCYLDIEIENDPVGRIIVELFNDICPITCENFRALCTGEKGLGQTTKKPLWYRNTVFHRVVKNFVIQSGDFESGNGTGGESIFGGQFADENFILSHDKPFLLSMANKGKNTNGSQFFITLQASPHLDQLHTVFGHVISGHEVINQIENIKIDQNSRPVKEIKIAQCGELVLKSEKRKKRKMSTSVSSCSEEEKRKKRKKHKKEKKNKKEKKSKGFYSKTKQAEEDIACNVDPDEIPAIPANVFLMRRTSPIEDREFRRAPRGREFKRYPPTRTRSGRKVKGRGNMRYRTPSSDEPSGSETPPHWKQAQSRLKKLKEVIINKENDENPASDVSNDDDDDDDENKSPHNPFLQSRLGLVSTKKFDDKRCNFDEDRNFDNNRGRSFSERRRDVDGNRRDVDGNRRDVDGNRRDFDGERRRSFNDDRRKKDARMNINENRRKRDFSPESTRYNQDNDDNDEEPENLFDKLFQEDQQHGTSWFDEKNQDESDESSSPLRSKIVVKSSVSRRDSRNDKKNDRDNNRRYNETSRKRDSLSDKRYRDRHRESSSGRDNSYKKSELPKENKDFNKNLKDKMNEKKKQLSVKTKKRLNLLENDLFRYAKQEIPKTDKFALKTNNEKSMNKGEGIEANLINNVLSSNLAALKEYEKKSNEKSGHESNDKIKGELSKHESEKGKYKTEEIIFESVSTKSNIESHESQLSDSSSLQKVVEYEIEKKQNNPSIKLCSNFSRLRSLSITASDEESSKDSESNEQAKSSLNISKYGESTIELQKPVEFDEHKLEHVEKIVRKFTKSKEENEYNLPDVIPLPDEREDYNIQNEDDIVKKSNKAGEETAEEKGIDTLNLSPNVQVAEISSVVSPETTRDEYENKGKKTKHESKRKNSPQRRSQSPPHRHSPSPPRRHSPSPPRRRSPSPPRRRSPSPPRRRSPSPPRRHSPSPPRRRSPSSNQEPQKEKKIKTSVSPSRSKSPLHLKTVKRLISKSPDIQKPSTSKQSLHSRQSKSPVSRRKISNATTSKSRSRSPISRRKISDVTRSKSRSRSPISRRKISDVKTSKSRSRSQSARQSKSPVNRVRSPISRRKISDAKTSRSRSRSQSARRSTSRSRIHRKYSRSPNVRQRRSRSRPHIAGRGSRSYRQSGMRNRSPELRSSFQRRNRSPYRRRARGRSASRRSNTRSRSHSSVKKRRRRRQESSSSSSSSSSRSDNVKRRNLKNSAAKGRNKRSSSSSSSASSRSKRSNS